MRCRFYIFSAKTLGLRLSIWRICIYNVLYIVCIMYMAKVAVAFLCFLCILGKRKHFVDSVYSDSTEL